MKGNNTMTMNEATMIAAMQHYLDTVVMKEAGLVKVVSVKASSERVHGMHSASVAFDVATTDPDKKPF